MADGLVSKLKLHQNIFRDFSASAMMHAVYVTLSLNRLAVINLQREYENKLTLSSYIERSFKLKLFKMFYKQIQKHRKNFPSLCISILSFNSYKRHLPIRC